MAKAIYELEPIGENEKLEAVAVHWYCSNKCQCKGILSFPIQQPITVDPAETDDFEDGAICEACNVPLVAKAVA